jgi:hypothetical protein
MLRLKDLTPACQVFLFVSYRLFILAAYSLVVKTTNVRYDDTIRAQLRPDLVTAHLVWRLNPS